MTVEHKLAAYLDAYFYEASRHRSPMNASKLLAHTGGMLNLRHDRDPSPASRIAARELLAALGVSAPAQENNE